MNVEEVIEEPLRIVQNVFARDVASGAQDKAQFSATPAFDEILAGDAWYKVPLLSDLASQGVQTPKAGSLVRFRCMVQDTGLGQEYFVSAFQERDGAWKCTHYSDEVPSEGDHLEAELLDEKQWLYCVSVPGETDWVQQTRCSSVDGRHGNEDTLSDMLSRLTVESNDVQENKSANSEDSHDWTTIPSKFPLPGRRHLAAVVKIYGREDNIKVTDMIEFVGILGKDMPSGGPAEDEFGAPSVKLDGVRVLHAITWRKLSGSAAYRESLGAANDATVLQRAPSIRAQIIHYIAQVLGGDELAAEWVLLHMLSRVHTRRGSLVLGNFALGLTNVVPSNSSSGGLSMTDLLTALLSTLLPTILRLPLTIEQLNNSHYFPRSEYDNLLSGHLQLTSNTYLLVDETRLQEGNLQEQGLKNIQALQGVMNGQSLHYAFPYSSFEIQTDLETLVVSTGKPLLQTPAIIPVIPIKDGVPTSLPAIDDQTLNEWRIYLQQARWIDHDIPSDISSYIQEQYVKERKQGSKIGQEDLMLHMTLARLVAQSFGQSELNVELWDYAVSIDEKRCARLETEDDLEEVSLDHVEEEEEVLSDSDYSDYSDSEDDHVEESLLDRVYALRDMIPLEQRTAFANASSTAFSYGRTGVQWLGKGAWVVTTSMLLLVLPLALEIEKEAALVQYEKEAMQQQQGAQQMLTPNIYGQPQPGQPQPQGGKVVPPGFQ
ncbi:hypothetical protein BZG36_05195 [Bifiguratus adelaidae]|uniref:Mini-chromosome maintenance complex-binding protein n=1 Tax=Bifiguratus adelaidae TaxID=1938954 RepID=A0A261XVP0_9FUNG|nr:hypothetical protein BZG36_05195 [Bifiguratus adelaidae]